MLILKYEDLLDTCRHQVFRMKEFLPMEITDENMVLACQRASFKEMKELEQYEIENKIVGLFYNPIRAKSYAKHKVQFVNKGIKGNYKNYFNEELLKKAKETFAEGMELVGYNPDDFQLN